jgi:hypothetical protein
MNELMLLIGNSSFFASRAFLPPLMLILSYRFPEYIPFVNDSIKINPNSSWFFSDPSLYTFSALSAFELIAMKSQTVSAFFDEFMQKLKVVLAVITNTTLLSPEIAATLNNIQTAGFSPMQLLAIGSAAIVHYVGIIRAEIYEFLSDLDDDDDLKLQMSLSFFEDFSVVTGMVLIVVIPLVVIIVVGIILLILWLFHRHFEKKEEATKVECSNCNALILPSATECFSCHTSVETPTAIGWLGQITDKKIDSIDKQEVMLLNARRCPHCATKLKKGYCSQKCDNCDYELNIELFQLLMDSLKAKLLIGMIITALIGFIPIVGSIFAIIYIKIAFVKPVKQYIPRTKAIFTKIMLKIITLVFILLQAIPFAGAIIPPLLLIINYFVWNKKLKKELTNSFEQATKL